MLKDIKKRTEGFTIIEVLIVLAIAGLILLIVFLAVPALQRNSRNTAMKNDVSAVLGGISEYANLNNGAFPNQVATSGSKVTIDNTSGSDTKAVANVQGSTTAEDGNAPQGGLSGTDVTPGKIIIVFGKTCGGSNSTRAVSAWYSVEAQGGNHNQCQDS